MTLTGMMAVGVLSAPFTIGWSDRADLVHRLGWRLSGAARKFVGGQAARGCAGSVVTAGRWRSSRSIRSARSVVVNFHLNGFAAWL